MPSITRSALVPQTAAEMYSLVSDIPSYPQFLPWCESTVVKESSDKHQIATIVMDRRMRGASFTTRNQLVPDRSLRMGLIEGPFKQLKGHWRFTPVSEQGCRVELAIEFEFKSRVLATLVGPAFTRICDSMVAAFTRRANELHPPSA